MIEQTEEPVKIHVRGTLQEVLLQRVLEIVDSFFGILQTVVLEDYLVHVSISNESALEERPSLRCFDRCEGYPIIYEFFIPDPADFSFVRWRLLGGHRQIECLFSIAG